MTTSLESHVAALRAGLVLACPTETQMGLLADARSESAVARICAMKRRPAQEAIALIVPSLEHAVELVGTLPGPAAALAARYWPGPLTLVLEPDPAVLASLPAPLLRDGTLALRVPGPSPALELLRAFGGPLTATSANISGQAPLDDPAELRATFGAHLHDVVPGRPPGGAPSTIVDARATPLRVLRAGAIALAPSELGC